MTKEEIIKIHGKKDNFNEARYQAARTCAKENGMSEEEAFISLINLEKKSLIVFDGSKECVKLKPKYTLVDLIKLPRRVLIALFFFIVAVLAICFYQVSEVHQKLTNPNHKTSDPVGTVDRGIESILCQDPENDTCKKHREFTKTLKEKLKAGL